MRQTFERVSLLGRRKRNGKWQQKTFWQTMNPFNKDEQGFPKSRDQILEELEEERLVWTEGEDD